MVNAQVDRLVESYASRLEQQGISLEMYVQYMAMTADKLRDDLKEPAVTQIKQQLALDAWWLPKASPSATRKWTKR